MVNIVSLSDKKLIVTQSREMIQSSYLMTAEEKILLSLFVGLIRKDDTDFDWYRISANEIRKKLNWESKNFYERIKEVTFRLFERKIYLQDKDAMSWEAYRWVAACRYVAQGEKGAKESYIEFSFPVVLRPFLLQLKEKFASYEFTNISSMGSFHAIRIYEMLNDYRGVGKYKVAIDDLKKRLGIEDKYPNFADFSRRVIAVSQDELLKKSDLAFDFTTEKTGRAVTSITFHIRDNIARPAAQKSRGKSALAMEHFPEVDEAQPSLFAESEEDKKYAELMRRVYDEAEKSGVAPVKIKALMEGRNPSHVLENIELARKRFYKDGKAEVVNLGGLTVSAIIDDYAAIDRDNRKVAEDRKAQEKKKAYAADLLERIKSEVRSRRIAAHNTIWDSLSEQEKEAFRSDFAEAILSGSDIVGERTRTAFGETGWKTIGITPIFTAYTRKALLPPEIDELRETAKQHGADYDELQELAGEAAR